MKSNPIHLAQNLAEQVDYYDARAPEYDEWWLRQGRFDHGAAANARWREEIAVMHAALEAAGIEGEVLELAAGTGNWTLHLAQLAAHVTALDASPEMIAINRARLEAAELVDRVTFHQVDLFAWQPDRSYDAAVLGFFLSHVPVELEDTLMTNVAAAVKPGGIVFFADSKREPSSTALDQTLPGAGEQIMTRTLNDGRSFEIIKRYRSMAEMTDLFARHGIAIEVQETPSYFQFGCGHKKT
jgi:demethylmenaquinone methyltransferase/2-methoxy-6-polyprenyl-1,4-benzoquinol methylase